MCDVLSQYTSGWIALLEGVSLSCLVGGTNSRLFLKSLVMCNFLENCQISYN